MLMTLVLVHLHCQETSSLILHWELLSSAEIKLQWTQEWESWKCILCNIHLFKSSMNRDYKYTILSSCNEEDMGNHRIHHSTQPTLHPKKNLYLTSFWLLEIHNCGPAYSESFPDTKTSSFGYAAHSCPTTAYLVMKNSCVALQTLCTAFVLLGVWQTIKGDGASVYAHCLFRTKAAATLTKKDWSPTEKQCD